MFYDTQGKLRLSDREFVNLQRPMEEIEEDIKLLESHGYLATGQFYYDIMYENPNMGNKENILRKHEKHKSMCEKYWAEHPVFN